MPDHRRRPPPEPPRPELVRRPSAAFGWLEADLLHDGWLARLGPEATATLTLLALAADRRGASFYGRARMAERLGLARSALDQGLARLLDLGLVVHRPWRPGAPDGVWQLVPLPAREREPRGGEALSVAAILARMGLA